MHRRHRGWFAGWVGLCAGLLLLDGAGHVRDAEGCSGAPPGGGGGGEEPPACQAFQVIGLEIPHAIVPASPGTIPLEVRVKCAAADQGPGVLSAPITVTVRPAGGGDAIAGSTTGNAPTPLTSSRELDRGWSPAAPLAAGTYAVSAQLDGVEGATASATFEVQVPYAPEARSMLASGTHPEEDPASEQVCCKTCGGSRCVRTRHINRGAFRASWAATPWIAAEITWDDMPPRTFAGSAPSSDDLPVAASGQHCARVVLSDLTTGATLDDTTHCKQLCFEPSVPTSCDQARAQLHGCDILGPRDHEAFLDEVCAAEPVTPVCDGTPHGAGADDTGSSAGCAVGARAGGGWLLALAALAAGRRRRPSQPPLRQAKGRRRG